MNAVVCDVAFEVERNRHSFCLSSNDNFARATGLEASAVNDGRIVPVNIKVPVEQTVRLVPVYPFAPGVGGLVEETVNFRCSKKACLVHPLQFHLSMAANFRLLVGNNGASPPQS